MFACPSPPLGRGGSCPITFNLVPTGESFHGILTKSILTVPVKYSLLQKAAGVNGFVSLVDVYGTLLGSRILVPSDVRTLDPQHLSLHLMRKAIDRGQLPLPIFTAIQHGRFSVGPCYS